MIELPEALTIARQMNKELKGKCIESSVYMDSPHRFAFYNRERTPEEYETILNGRAIGQVVGQASHILIPLEPGYVLKLGDGGERILFHKDENTLPKKHQLLLHFEDDTYLTVSIQGWGAVEIEQQAKFRAYKPGRTSPLSDAFTLEYFRGLFAGLTDRKTIKHFLISEPGIPGVGNGCLQDILFRARIHPKRRRLDLSEEDQQALHRAIVDTLEQAVAQGGRDTERDLYNQLGGYPKILDSSKRGEPCPECGRPIEKMNHLGGSCYLCPSCQV